jgi:hypothetical protein
LFSDNEAAKESGQWGMASSVDFDFMDAAMPVILLCLRLAML